MDFLDKLIQFFVYCCSLCFKFHEAMIDEASSSTSFRKLSDSLYLLHEPDPPHITSIDIIFFHGLQFEQKSDAHLSTWRSGGDRQELWPKWWLPERYPEARIISVSYDASIRTTNREGVMDMHLIGEKLLTEILWIPRQQGKECPVVLVGHSFGGLVIKQLCVHACRNKEISVSGQGIRKFLDNIGGIFFYGTPHRGIETADLRKYLVMSRIPANESLLKFVKLLGEDAARLHEELDGWRRNYNWLIYGVGEPLRMDGSGQCSVQVKEGSSRYGENYITVECDHFSVCRPVSKTSAGYLHLVELIYKIYDQRSKDERRKHEDVVGVESLLGEVQELLQRWTFLGFCGMGGVGKTTVAKLAFDIMSAKFEYTCFVSEVKLIQGDKEEIKKKMWKRMRCHGRSVRKGIFADMWTEVRGKRLLVVFDDIDRLEHAKLLREIADDNALEESRFLTTSRDKEVLRFLNNKIYIYDIPVLGHEVARKLFIRHAFPTLEQPPEHLERIVNEVVVGCGGLPLMLEVHGKNLVGERRVEIWDETSKNLRDWEPVSASDKIVWGKLRLSYDGLQDSEKHMFLDVASFLLLRSCPFSFVEARAAWSFMFGAVGIRLKSLVDKSLMVLETAMDIYKPPRLEIESSGTNSFRIVRMHEQLRRMGQKIAKESGRHVEIVDNHGQEDCKHGRDDYVDYNHDYVDSDDARKRYFNPAPGARIRTTAFLCRTIEPQKVVVLRVAVGAHDSSDGDMDRSGDNSCSPCQMWKFFSQLEAVRYLDLDMRRSVLCERCRIRGGCSLPERLVMFRWTGTNVNVKLPLKASVCSSLVVLRLERDDDCSKDIISRDACRYLSMLERLSMKSPLVSIPCTFGNLTNLKHLVVHSCQSLEGLPKTFGNLRSLEHLEIKGCRKLKRLPESFGDLYKLKYLEVESCMSLAGLPKKFGNLRSLEHLEIKWCFLERLPETFGHLERLKYLKIEECGNLTGLPDSVGDLRSLKHLKVEYCRKFEWLPEKLENLISLEHLELNN